LDCTDYRSEWGELPDFSVDVTQLSHDDEPALPAFCWSKEATNNSGRKLHTLRAAALRSGGAISYHPCLAPTGYFMQGYLPPESQMYRDLLLMYLANVYRQPGSLWRINGTTPLDIRVAGNLLIRQTTERKIEVMFEQLKSSPSLDSVTAPTEAVRWRDPGGTRHGLAVTATMRLVHPPLLSVNFVCLVLKLYVN